MTQFAHVKPKLRIKLNLGIGYEDATWQQVQARGVDDIHSGNASIFQYFEYLNPSGDPPFPAEACQADQACCYDEPFLSDLYSSYLPQDPNNPQAVYPWFNPNWAFLAYPKPNIMAQEICFYTKWGLRYVSIVARVLFSSGGALAAPEIAVPVGTILLILNVGQWIACGWMKPLARQQVGLKELSY